MPEWLAVTVLVGTLIVFGVYFLWWCLQGWKRDL